MPRYRSGVVEAAPRTAHVSARAWIAVAAALTLGAPPLGAQSTSPSQPDVALGSTLTAETLRDLPASGNIFSVLETTQAEVVSDRFYTGGVNTALLPRLGAFLSSTTQTHFRVGDVNITDPRGDGSPSAFPDVSFWERVIVATGLTDVDIAAPGLAVSLEPRRPSVAWTRTVDGSLSGAPLVAGTTAGVPPPIAQLDGWHHLSAFASGPLVAAQPDRLGLAVGGSWTGASQVASPRRVRLQRDRQNLCGGGQADTNVDAAVASALANLVFKRSADEEVRTVGWLQRSQATQRDLSVHVQSTWERRVRRQAGYVLRSPERVSQQTAWRVFGAFTQRTRAADRTLTSGEAIDRLVDGPVPEFVETGGGTDRRWSLGGRAAMAPRTIARLAHTFEAGLDVGGQRARVGPAFSGELAELVDTIEARVWSYSNPGLDAHRRATTVAVYAADRIDVTPTLVVNGGFRFDSVSGVANGAANGVSWRTWLPRVTVRWAPAAVWDLAVFAGYGRIADSLSLDALAYGDPAAPVANVYRRMSTGINELVARVGPGTGGNANFSAIDISLERPVTDVLVAGVESRPTRFVRLRFSGVVKREQHMLGVVNVGVPPASYSTLVVPDPGLDLAHADDDQQLTVHNRLPASFGRDRYVLTNPSQDAATFSGLVLSADASTDRLLLLFGATASRTDAPAGNRGFHANENDNGVLGELFTDPNAATFARGRLFSDRAYTMKLTTVYRFPNDVRFGAIARYQDGQPFSRMVVVPDLAQGADAVRAFPNGRSRFTFTSTIDLRLQKGWAIGRTRVAAIFDLYNAVNLRNEVEERVVTGPGFRTVTAVQPPRTIHLGARVTF